MQIDNIPQTLELLQAAILHKLGAEVDLIFQYGSQVRGNTHRYSDLDISYVPVHEETWDCITVLVADRLIDLYPMHWSKLERMTQFRDVSSSVLLQNRVTYFRDQETVERFHSLGEQLKSLLEPEARPQMVRRALEIFQTTSYAYYLLHHEAEAGHGLGCIQQAQFLLRTVLHCLAVCNQELVDTRKLEQVFGLPLLPARFVETARRITAAVEPGDLLDTCETLLRSTRELLLSEQRRSMIRPAAMPDIFNAAYPEFRRDLQQILLSCERQDMFTLRGSLVSLYHELSIGLAQVRTGVEMTGFNSLSEYEQNLDELGFPALAERVKTGDYDAIRQECTAFDRHLREFLTGQSVGLNSFSSADDFSEYLESTSKKE